MRYPIIIEKAKNNYAAYSPDVPGCVATGKTIEEVKQQFAEALEFHFEGLREDNEPIPQPRTLLDYIELPTSA
ncbi:type II toxin-antitoxin system HicB family antitoxin [Pleurocapsales cyanobacterium LEGE 10410]|nr:type II toxin-antitoxin system HicB family antitoxin [Pleurocapsales cyanobacterium LEGE 10410]